MTNSDDEAEVMVAKPRPKPVPHNKQVTAPVPTSEVKVKKELKAITKVKGDSPILVTSNSNTTPSASLNGLPEFTHSAWNTEDPYGCQVSVSLTAWFQFQSSSEVTTVTGCPM